MQLGPAQAVQHRGVQGTGGRKRWPGVGDQLPPWMFCEFHGSRHCPHDSTWRGRSIQVRLDVFNVFNEAAITNRNASIQYRVRRIRSRSRTRRSTLTGGSFHRARSRVGPASVWRRRIRHHERCSSSYGSRSRRYRQRSGPRAAPRSRFGTPAESWDDPPVETARVREWRRARRQGRREPIPRSAKQR